MEPIAITALICVTVIYLAERARQVFQLRATMERPLQAAPALPPEEKVPDPIPSDLAQLALRESADWARQDAIKAMYELYEATRDWNTVRAIWHPDRGPVS